MNFNKILLFPLLFATTLNACDNNTSSNGNTTTTTQSTQTTSSMKQLVKDGAFLVDVRTPEEFKNGSVSGAVNIPLNEVEKRIGEFKDKKHVIVFCASGNRSGQAQRILNQNGIENVTNGGGWESLKSEIE